MMRYELKSIGIWGFIRVAFFVNLVAGFIIGFLYGLFLSLVFTVWQQFPILENLGGGGLESISFGVLLIVLPIMGAVGGAIFFTLFGVIIIVIYNLITRLTGGLEFDLQPAGQPSPRPMTAYGAVPPGPPPPPPVHPGGPSVPDPQSTLMPPDSQISPLGPHPPYEDDNRSGRESN